MMTFPFPVDMKLNLILHALEEIAEIIDKQTGEIDNLQLRTRILEEILSETLLHPHQPEHWSIFVKSWLKYQDDKRKGDSKDPTTQSGLG